MLVEAFCIDFECDSNRHIILQVIFQLNLEKQSELYRGHVDHEGQ